jgi:hypothetical protein
MVRANDRMCLRAGHCPAQGGRQGSGNKFAKKKPGCARTNRFMYGLRSSQHSLQSAGKTGQHQSRRRSYNGIRPAQARCPAKAQGAPTAHRTAPHHYTQRSHPARARNHRPTPSSPHANTFTGTRTHLSAGVRATTMSASDHGTHTHTHAQNRGAYQTRYDSLYSLHGCAPQQGSKQRHNGRHTYAHMRAQVHAGPSLWAGHQPYRGGTGGTLPPAPPRSGPRR